MHTDTHAGRPRGPVFLAYATVFFLEGMMLLIALLISFRLRVEASRASAEAKAAAW